jgi:PAS domain S-box-containing protein
MDVIDLNGRVLDCNQHFAAFLGLNRAQLLSPSSTFFDYTHPDSLSVSFEMLSNLIANPRNTVRGVKRYVTKGGRVRSATITAWMCEDGGGRANHVVVIVEPAEDLIHGGM